MASSTSITCIRAICCEFALTKTPATRCREPRPGAAAGREDNLTLTDAMLHRQFSLKSLFGLTAAAAVVCFGAKLAWPWRHGLLAFVFGVTGLLLFLIAPFLPAVFRRR